MMNKTVSNDEGLQLRLLHVFLKEDNDNNGGVAVGALPKRRRRNSRIWSSVVVVVVGGLLMLVTISFLNQVDLQQFQQQPPLTQYSNNSTEIIASSSRSNDDEITTPKRTGTTTVIEEGQQEQQDQDQGEVATKILMRQQHQLDNLYNGRLINDETTHNTTVVVKFRPGSLNMTAQETFQYCHCDPEIYKYHFSRFRIVSISSKYRLVYVMVSKSGSSTARTTMNTMLNATDKHRKSTEEFDELLHVGPNNYTVFTFVRDPLSRFLSGYQEAFKKSAPWLDKSRKQKVPPPSYLYQGLKTIEDYSNLYCPPEVLEREKQQHCNQTYENGTLVARFERFVSEYDGLSPFDGHIELQVPKLSKWKTGAPYKIDEIYNTAKSKESWNMLIQKHAAELIPTFESMHLYSHFSKIDVTKISNNTKQRICELGLIDYCCLNLKLPPPCSNVSLHCKLSHRPGPRDKGRRRRKRQKRNTTDTTNIDTSLWRIEPWNFPYKK